MTKYEIAEKIYALLNVDYDDLIEAIQYLAYEVENDEENYLYKGECKDGTWVEGYVLPTKDGKYRIVTNDMCPNEKLCMVWAREVDPDTIEAV